MCKEGLCLLTRSRGQRKRDCSAKQARVLERWLESVLMDLFNKFVSTELFDEVKALDGS
jgi:hypothetical protein